MRRFTGLAASAALGVVLLGASFVQAAAEDVTIKMWTWADRSGPLRSGNIVAAGKQLNDMLAASGSSTRVKVDVYEDNADGFDTDALTLLKAFAVNKGPDVYVAAHEWIGEFARNGYAMDLDKTVADNQWAFGDVVPVLWNATKYQGKIYAIPQDTEIRMIFYNKDMLRKIGKTEEFIDSIPTEVASGQMTAADWGELVKEVVDKGAAKLGQLHRPNVGPDYLMSFAAFGVQWQDPKTGKLLLQVQPMQKALEWFNWMARNNATPPDNTAMSWDDIQNAFKQGRAFAYHHGIWTMSWQLGDHNGATWPTDQEGYFKKIGWIPMPAGEKGGKTANLSHPVVYIVNPKSPHADLAAQLVAIATLPYYNVAHAVGSYHLSVLNGAKSMPAYQKAWPLAVASDMLPDTSFMPNNPDFPKYNAVLFKALQGVETGRLSPEDAVSFLQDELQSELGDELEIVQ
jgi:inositol-phosphate transport system substrate-binding protein